MQQISALWQVFILSSLERGAKFYDEESFKAAHQIERLFDGSRVSSSKERVSQTRVVVAIQSLPEESSVVGHTQRTVSIALPKKVGKRPNCAHHGGHISELLFGIRIDWWRSAPPMPQNLKDLAEAPGIASSTDRKRPQNLLKVWSVLNNQQDAYEAPRRSSMAQSTECDAIPCVKA
ncbi:hypothetical protein MAN_01535, partial [Metarhizium hybridum]